jgi:hypothetical protein
MLYPTTINPAPTYQTNYVIPNGNLYSFTFTLNPGDQQSISIIHTAGDFNQDRSLLAWVSTQPGGQYFYNLPAYLQCWHPNRRINSGEFIVYDSSLDTVQADYAIPLAPGNYFINVLNLVNLANAFSYILTDLG